MVLINLEVEVLFMYLDMLKWIMVFLELKSSLDSCLVVLVFLILVGLMKRKELIGWLDLFKLIWFWWMVWVILLMVLFWLMMWFLSCLLRFLSWFCFCFCRLLIGMLVIFLMIFCMLVVVIVVVWLVWFFLVFFLVLVNL